VLARGVQYTKYEEIEAFARNDLTTRTIALPQSLAMTTEPSVAAKELERLVPPQKAPPITSDERLARLEAVRRLMRHCDADALLVGTGPSLNYFAGISWNPSERLTALLLPASGEPIIVCPHFERGSLEAELKIAADLRLWQEDESPFTLIGQAMRDLRLRVLAVDPALPFGMVDSLVGETGLDIVQGAEVIGGCRIIKSPAEIAILQQAKTMTLMVQKATARILREGMTTTEVEQLVEAAHRRLGAPGSFFCDVAFGRGTAFPHGLPETETLRENDLVLVDCGCAVQGYLSDMTRTYCFGRPTAEQRRIWEIEKAAELAAFARVAVGVPCEEVDAAVRAVLVKHGLGPDYRLPGLPHRTGHGIGLSLHEPPYIVRGNKTPLEPGMCFSDEPMIVVPDRFGVRLEDHIHVTDNGPVWFTPPQEDIVSV